MVEAGPAAIPLKNCNFALINLSSIASATVSCHLFVGVICLD